MPRLFIFYHPSSRGGIDYLPWLHSLNELMGQGLWADWDMRSHEYINSSFRIAALRARVGLNPGGVLFTAPVDRTAVGEFRRLRPATTTVLASVFCSHELLSAAEGVREEYVQGQPLLPRKQVVAVFIIRKLFKRHFWSGNHCYQKGDDFYQGGFPERLCQHVPDVANDLLSKNFLCTKKKKGQGTKWALNSDYAMRHQIMALFHGEVASNGLQKIFDRDRCMESARLIDTPEKVQKYRIRSAGGEWKNCTSIADAVSQTNALLESPLFACEVVFEDGQSLLEEATSKVALRSFLAIYEE